MLSYCVASVPIISWRFFHLFISLNRLPFTSVLNILIDFFRVCFKTVLEHTYDIKCTCNTSGFVGLFTYLIHMCLWAETSFKSVVRLQCSGCWAIVQIRLLEMGNSWILFITHPLNHTKCGSLRAVGLLTGNHPLEFLRPFWGSGKLTEPLRVDDH